MVERVFQHAARRVREEDPCRYQPGKRESEKAIRLLLSRLIARRSGAAGPPALD